MSSKKQTIAILDAGAQYGKVIDRRIRELSVRSELLPFNTSAKKLAQYGAVIISGGPESVYNKTAPEYDAALFSTKVPILGICYGMQVMNYQANGVIERKSTREDGQHEVELKNDCALFKGLSDREVVLMSHGDTVDQVGEGFSVTAKSGDLIAGIANEAKKQYGVQFHPEVDLTEHGRHILENFVFAVAALEPTFTIENREEQAIKHIKKTVGDRHVLLLVSGGIDSTVAAVLLGKAIEPEKLHLLHVDSGLMRKEESAQVAKALAAVGLKLHVVDATQEFLEATTEIDGKQTVTLTEALNPEVKRKIIGDTFIAVADREVARLQLPENEVVLGQGTLRPDLIESASETVSATAQTIKTHHNDTALVRRLRAANRVVEPLSEYHKDEVRQLAEELGLPAELVWRQPFPGPGLGIRILCANKPYKTKDFKQVAKQAAGFSTGSHQVALLPVRTVGVQGDGRTYSYLVGVFGSADWQTLFQLARDIPKTIHAVNRVAYFWGDAPTTADSQQITSTTVTKKTLTQLRAADAIVMEELLRYDLVRGISQVPVVLVPLSFGKTGARSIALRTIMTNDFMTGKPALPGEDIPIAVLTTMVERILSEVQGVERVCYDVTSKPPATTEWE
ncbi:MAG: glutamine-hydrolyzing GMP synthase [Patescibacteria group bacterium]